jgi:glutathione S-transferase
LEREAISRTWFTGEAFGLADCAAAPALYYANRVRPLEPQQAAAGAYLARLCARPSVARVLEEAAPYFGMFPQS